MKDCRLSNAVCNFCGKKGHIEAACITKQRSSKVNLITTSTINSLTDEIKEPSPSVSVTINNRKFPFLVDTGASCNPLSSSTGKKIGTPTLQKDETRPLISASNDVIPTSGSVDLDVTVTTKDGDANSRSDPAIYCHRPAGHPWYQRHQLPPADDQEQPSEGARGQHTHYPEPPTSPVVMFTDLQGVPGPVEA